MEYSKEQSSLRTQRRMSLPYQKIGIEEVSEGGFFIVRYMPFFQDKGIAATLITEVREDGFRYENLGMGIGGEYPEMFDDSDDDERALISLPEGFKPPLRNDLVHNVAGVYVPEEKKDLLKNISKDRNYLRSLETLGLSESLKTENLLRILTE